MNALLLSENVHLLENNLRRRQLHHHYHLFLVHLLVLEILSIAFCKICIRHHKRHLLISQDFHLCNPCPWVLNFPPCRGPGGSIPTGNVASLVSSNCPLWEERRGNTTRLPWVATRKPEEGILEVASYWEFVLS